MVIDVVGTVVVIMIMGNCDRDILAAWLAHRYGPGLTTLNDRDVECDRGLANDTEISS